MPYPGIFRVTCPTPFPGLPHVHCYLAEGESGGLVLVDTTLGWDDSFERIEQGVHWLGRSFGDIERIYLTHAHPDHVGLAAKLQEASGAEVACHPICERGLETMQTPDRWRGIAERYREHGWDPGDVVEPGLYLPMPERIVHLEAGSAVRFAGGEWDVAWTPGHEWGHVAFHRPADGLLISGDTLLLKITPHVGYTFDPPDPLGMFLDSLEALAALEPSLVVPGHGRSFEEGAQRARMIGRHHNQRLGRILEILFRRGPLPAIEIAWELFGQDLMYFQERLALAETLAHTEHLRLKGRLDWEKVDGIWRYGVAADIVP